MTIEFISIEEYIRILSTIGSGGFSIEEPIVLHEGCLIKITDMYKPTFMQLVPDTGLMRVLV